MFDGGCLEVVNFLFVGVNFGLYVLGFRFFCG